MRAMSFRATLMFWCFLLVPGLQAKEQTVQMLNEKDGQMMVFSKELVFLEVGESLLWRATDKTHSVMFLTDGIPHGVETFRSPFNVDGRFLFKTPGVYVYKCLAHYGMGMIGVVVVGRDTHNLDKVKKLKLLPAPQRKLLNIIDQIEKTLAAPIKTAPTK